MGPLFHACSPAPGRSGSVRGQVGFVFAGVRLVQARPSSPPPLVLVFFRRPPLFVFPCLFRVRPLRARCVGVGVLSWFLLFFFACPVSCSC